MSMTFRYQCDTCGNTANVRQTDPIRTDMPEGWFARPHMNPKDRTDRRLYACSAGCCKGVDEKHPYPAPPWKSWKELQP